MSEAVQRMQLRHTEAMREKRKAKSTFEKIEKAQLLEPPSHCSVPPSIIETSILDGALRRFDSTGFLYLPPSASIYPLFSLDLALTQLFRPPMLPPCR